MRASLIALLVVACATSACSKKSSLYLEPGQRVPSPKAGPLAASPPAATPAIPQPVSSSQPSPSPQSSARVRSD
jgi:predicted small lipoprotein YifL